MDAAVDSGEPTVAFELSPGDEGVLEVVLWSHTRLDLGRPLRKLDRHVEVVPAKKPSGGFGMS